MDVDEAIRRRRTVKQFSGAPVAREDLEALLDLAVWAPNHHLTEPWRFVVVHEEAARARLADAVDGGYLALGKPGGDEAAAARLERKRADMHARILRAGAVIVVTAAASQDDPQTAEEDYAATCCAIHTILLAATARGLASYWSTGKPFRSDPVREALELPRAERFCGVIFLGYPEGELRRAGRRTAATTFTRWAGA